MREIILDTETTGLDPGSGHRIIEIGCVELVHKMRTGKHFHRYINPLREVPREAEMVHGISSSFLLDKPTFAEIADELVAFLGDDVLIIHNASFDMKFLNHELKLHGYVTLPLERATCTLSLARQKFPGSPASLDALCRRYEIDLANRVKHGALLDAELLAEVYVELTGGRQVIINFADKSAKQETVGGHPVNAYALPERNFGISDEEAAAHAALLAMLKQPVWNAVEFENTRIREFENA